MLHHLGDTADGLVDDAKSLEVLDKDCAIKQKLSQNFRVSAFGRDRVCRVPQSTFPLKLEETKSESLSLVDCFYCVFSFTCSNICDLWWSIFTN